LLLAVVAVAYLTAVVVVLEVFFPPQIRRFPQIFLLR
jgi:hypothetical protein